MRGEMSESTGEAIRRPSAHHDGTQPSRPGCSSGIICLQLLGVWDEDY